MSNARTEWVPPECDFCGAVMGHDPRCADRARARAREAEQAVAALEHARSKLLSDGAVDAGTRAYVAAQDGEFDEQMSVALTEFGWANRRAFFRAGLTAALSHREEDTP